VTFNKDTGIVVVFVECALAEERRDSEGANVEVQVGLSADDW
jgi:hypothetical protein